MVPGEWTKPISRWRVFGPIFIVPWIPAAPRLTSGCRRSGMQLRPKSSSREPCGLLVIPPARDPCRRQSVLSEGDHGIEAGAQVRLPVSPPYLSLLEQHRGARPSGDQAAGEREPGIPIL